VDAAGKLLVVTGMVLALMGVLFILIGTGAVPRLPGTISFGKGNVRVFVPLGASILISIVLTILLNAFFRR
jgi:Protein of unknown function (DUF2905)